MKLTRENDYGSKRPSTWLTVLLIFLYIQTGFMTGEYYYKRAVAVERNAAGDALFSGIFWPVYWNFRAVDSIINPDVLCISRKDKLIKGAKCHE